MKITRCQPRRRRLLLLGVLVCFAAGCDMPGEAERKRQIGQKQVTAEMESRLAMETRMTERHDLEVAARLGQVAVAVMTPTAGNSAAGTVTFTQGEKGIIVEATIRGLEAGQQHAIHIHQYGDLRLDNGKGTGGHYNPEGHPHALPTSEQRHGGDLGNLTADAKGNASYSIVVTNITIDGDHNPIIGRGVIIHAKVDDGGQPTGNAGARISQGVIGIAKQPG